MTLNSMTLPGPKCFPQWEEFLLLGPGLYRRGRFWSGRHRLGCWRCADHFHHRVVIRNTARIEATGRDQSVDLRPVALHAAGLDAIYLHAAMEFAAIVAQMDGITL